MKGSKADVVAFVKTWYNHRAKSTPYYEIGHGRVFTANSDRFSNRAWKDGTGKDEEKNRLAPAAHECEAWLNEDLELIPPGTYCLRLRGGDRQTKDFQTLTFEIVSEKENQPAVNGVSSDFIRRTDMQVLMDGKIQELKKEMELQRLKEQIQELKKKKPESGAVDKLIAGFLPYTGQIVSTFFPPATPATVAGLNKPEPTQSQTPEPGKEQQTTASQTDVMVVDQVKALAANLDDETGEKTIKALSILNEKLNDPNVGPMLVSMLNL
jgi:hypothetical protein